jgi:hypothetical protein
MVDENGGNVMKVVIQIKKQHTEKIAMVVERQEGQ